MDACHMDLSTGNSYSLGGKTFKNPESRLQDREAIELKNEIEPWLSAILQSEHLSLLIGSGFTAAIQSLLPPKKQNHERDDGDTRVKTGMEMQRFDPFHERIQAISTATAKTMNRGTPNIEDQLRVSLSLLSGLQILSDTGSVFKRQYDELLASINKALSAITNQVLDAEKDVASAVVSPESCGAALIMTSFLMTFANRTATRDRLHIFTTNYDRLIEHGADLIGLRLLDRFVGALNPFFRSSRLDVDYHYSPPGIRGEPRYLEGVARLTKLHGSLDWRLEQNGRTQRLVKIPLPLGHPSLRASATDAPLERMIIYPNSAKDVETLEYPYAELFRDCASALCRPNSSLITYGYGFGDDHINRIIQDMLTIPSTHLVIISYNHAEGRIERFLEKAGRCSQISYLVGNDFGSLERLVEYYLPSPSIDRITDRKNDILRKRTVAPPPGDNRGDKNSQDSPEGGHSPHELLD